MTPIAPCPRNRYSTGPMPGLRRLGAHFRAASPAPHWPVALRGSCCDPRTAASDRDVERPGGSGRSAGCTSEHIRQFEITIHAADPVRPARQDAAWCAARPGRLRTLTVVDGCTRCASFLAVAGAAGTVARARGNSSAVSVVGGVAVSTSTCAESACGTGEILQVAGPGIPMADDLPETFKGGRRARRLSAT